MPAPRRCGTKSGGRVWWLVALMLVLAVPPGLARADRDHRRPWRGDRHFTRHDMRVWRGGHWYHGHHDGRLGWWWVAGALWYLYPRPIYPYPAPYVPPEVFVAPPVRTAPTPPPDAYWYYCEPRRAYYPYVRNCPVPWRVVPATPVP